MEHALLDLVMRVADNEWLSGAVLFATTFVLEDAATSIAALLASEGHLSVVLALSAVMSGIILGDLVLYGLGTQLRKWRWANVVLRRKTAKKTENFMRERLVLCILTARLIPGMRLPSYLAMGYFGLNFRVYALSVIFAVGVWTAGLFLLIYTAGSWVMETFEAYRWLGLLGLIVVGVIVPRALAKIVQLMKVRKLSDG